MDVFRMIPQASNALPFRKSKWIRDKYKRFSLPMSQNQVQYNYSITASFTVRQVYTHRDAVGITQYQTHTPHSGTSKHTEAGNGSLPGQDTEDDCVAGHVSLSLMFAILS